jgi:hypothetical protein
VQGRNEGRSLLRVAGRLLDELPEAGPVEVVGADSKFGDDVATSETFTPDDDALVRELRAALATIAARLGAASEEPSSQSVLTALDAAEIVMRGELTTGGQNRLPQLMPSLVFLVTLPIVEQDRALALSHRTAELIDEEAGD